MSRARSIPFALGGILAVIAALVVLLGILPATQRREALAAEAASHRNDAPRVVFVQAVAAPASVSVVLPARLLALQQTALFAQVSGYLGPLQADLGDAVHAGDLLVEIETPVLDRQIEQNESNRMVALAKIDLAEARLELAKASLERLRRVGDARAISQQAIDEAAANEKSDAASLAAAQADLAAVEADGRRLAALKKLARLVAPFDGEVTLRSYDTGALIVADRTDAGQPIFAVTNREEIRAFVDVPQSLAAAVRPGQPIEFTVRELPARVFKATVTRMAPSLDDVTRTRLVEARIDNADHVLLPGMFAEATLSIDRESPGTMVPGEAIIIRGGKQVVAVISDDDTLHYRDVKLGRDTGRMVEVLEGIPAGSRVAVNLSNQPSDAVKVAPVARPTQ